MKHKNPQHNLYDKKNNRTYTEPWFDENGKLCINPNADVILLDPQVFDKVRQIVTEQIDNEIIKLLRSKQPPRRGFIAKKGK